MTQTVRARRRFLNDRVGLLVEMIEHTGREAEVMALAEEVRAGAHLPEDPSDEEWDLLLPAEQAKLLPSYYLALRTELAVLNGQGADARHRGHLAEWLDGPVPKIASLGAAVTAVASLAATYGIEALRPLGLAYREDADGSRHITGEDWPE